MVSIEFAASQSRQIASNSVPLVLLHTARPPPPTVLKQFAKVFAEVTTYATPLDPLHEDWLRFGSPQSLGPDEQGGGQSTPGLEIDGCCCPPL